MTARTSKKPRKILNTTEDACSSAELDGRRNFENWVKLFPQDIYTMEFDAMRSIAGGAFEYRWRMIRNAVVRIIKTRVSPAEFTFRVPPNRYHGFVQILAVTEGCLAVTLNGSERFELRPGRLLVFNPSQRVHNLNREGSAEVLSVLMASNYFHEHCGYLSMTTGKLFVDSAEGPLQSWCADMIARTAAFADSMTPRQAEDITQALCVMLRPLYCEACSDSQRVKGTKRDFLRACAIEAMHEMMSESSLSLEDIAEKVGTSTRYLSALFKETGTTAMNKLMELRLERASTQLRDAAYKGLSIEEVAKQNGFVSHSHFGRVFRAKYGQTPREWRSRVKAYQGGTVPQVAADPQPE